MGLSRSVVRAFSRRYVIALGVAVAVMVGSVVAVNYVIDTKLNNVKRVAVKTAPAPSQGANYLLLGSDTRAFVKNKTQQNAFGNPGTVNSDTMMVVHVEPGSKKTLIVSFPRDLWVNIPGMGMNKINAAFGVGPDKVVQTLKADFNIDIAAIAPAANADMSRMKPNATTTVSRIMPTNAKNAALLRVMAGV